MDAVGPRKTAAPSPPISTPRRNIWSVGGADKASLAAKLYRGILERDPSERRGALRPRQSRASLQPHLGWALAHGPSSSRSAGTCRCASRVGTSRPIRKGATKMRSHGLIRSRECASSIPPKRSHLEMRVITPIDSLPPIAPLPPRSQDSERSLAHWKHGDMQSPSSATSRRRPSRSRAIEINPRLTSARLALATLLQRSRSIRRERQDSCWSDPLFE